MAAGKEFVMGARVNLTDGFTSPVSNMTRNAQHFKSSVDAANTSVQRFSSRTGQSHGELSAFTVASRSSAMSLRAIASGAMAATAALMGLGSVIEIIMGLLAFHVLYDWLVKSNAEMETYLNTLTVVLKSSEKAKDTLDWAVKFAATTPFEIPQVVEATTRLETYGLTAKKTLGIIGDMASVMGKPLMQAVEAVADAQTGEMERLKEFGITKDMLAKQSEKLGVKAVDNKGSIIDQKAFNAALFSLMEERYQGGMEMQSRSFNGMLSNLKDFIGSVGRELGKPIFDKFKEGLTSILEWTTKLQEGGMFDRVKAGAATFASAVVAAMGWLGEVFQRVIAVAGLLWPYVAPVFNFLVNTALPATIAALVWLAQLVLKVADAFINNWGWIEPMLQGIAAAFALIMGPAGLMAGYMYAAAKAARAWAIAQALLNGVMALNPAYLMVIAIGAVIGAVIWLVRNWETASAVLQTIWAAIRNFAAAAFFGIIGDLGTLFTNIAGFFANLLPSIAEWGSNIMTTLAQGILNGAYAVIDAVKGTFAKVREMMPFSDAKEGPFSQLTYSGQQLMATMAAGVDSQSGTLQRAVGRAFNGVGINPAGGSVSTAGGGRTVQIGTLVGSITLADVGNKDTAQLVDELLTELYARLQDATDIASTGDMEAIL